MMQIQEHVPGPELDALIAEKVMGWRWYDAPTDRDIGYDFHIPRFCPPEIGHWLPSTTAPKVPHYSTAIAAAWLIIEHLRTAYDLLLEVRPYSLRGGVGGYRVAIVYGARELDYETADGAPLAICRAGLTALQFIEIAYVKPDSQY